MSRIYKLTTSTETKIVHPINDDSLVYKWKKLKDSVSYEKELSTKLIFSNNKKLNINDFDFLFSYENNSLTRCEIITIEIFKKCNNNTEILEYKGIMPLNSGEWDLEKCIVKLEVKNNATVYDCIEENKKETNLPVSLFCPYGNAPSENYSPGFYLYGTPQSPTENTFLIINSLDGTYFPLTSPYNSPGVNYPYALFAVLCYRVVNELLEKCGRDSSLESLRSDFFDWNAKGDTVGYIASSIPKPSTSLTSANYPFGTYNLRHIYLPIDAGINYLTGQTNKLTHLVYMPKSNANDMSASAWEQDITSSGEPNSNKLTFEDIEKIWATMFQAYWFIDTDGCMRVEHISWFNNNANIYNTTLTPHKEFNGYNRKYTYQKELLPKKEIFKLSQNRDFVNGRVDTGASNKNNEIYYDSICVNLEKKNNEVEYNVNKVATDMLSLDSKNDIILRDYYDTNGIFLCVVNFSTPYNKKPYFIPGRYYIAETDMVITSETIHLSSSITTYKNAHIQWANLIRRYLKDNRVLTIGKNGNDLITFSNRLRKSKVQQNVILLNCCTDDEFNPQQATIITELGNGEVDEAEFDTKTGLIKIKVLHD